MKFVASAEHSFVLAITFIMAVEKTLVARSFVLSSRSSIVGSPIPTCSMKAGAFLQQRRSFYESTAIIDVPSLQRLQNLRWKPWNLVAQKRCSSNSEKVDPNVEKEEIPDESANSKVNEAQRTREEEYLWRDSEFNDSKEEEDPFFYLKYASMGGEIDPKHKEDLDKEGLPFWTTPERDPDKSIYIQHHIAEKDCKPLRLYIPTEECMEEIGTFVAMMIMTTPDLDTFEVMPNKGDVIFLKGDLGAGKSVFARGFVRGGVGNWEMEVPSPTYLLSNTYFASEKQNSNQDVE
jgi:Threonylcarbamoyl adenosine biosynthesis protein TsaE